MKMPSFGDSIEFEMAGKSSIMLQLSAVFIIS